MLSRLLAENHLSELNAIVDDYAPTAKHCTLGIELATEAAVFSWYDSDGNEGEFNINICELMLMLSPKTNLIVLLFNQIGFVE
jgi:hypothetical protein